MALPKVLITGSSGTVGRILMVHLLDDFELYGADLRISKMAANEFQTDISKHAQIAAVFEQIAPLPYVIHLAGDPRVEADWQSVLRNNIMGTRNVYEAAKVHGIRRIIFASSHHVAGMYEGKPPTLHREPSPKMISVRHEARPDSDYGTSKLFGEGLARQYYELYGVESICLRMGTVLADDSPTGEERHRKTWLSHRDLVALVKRSLLSDTKFGIYYGVSNNKGRYWDISNAKDEMDFEPVDDASVL
jgi:nucleoside-diphosphate-sugar epimerase